jgi:hypothetical protein
MEMLKSRAKGNRNLDFLYRFRSEVAGANLLLAVQGLQIGAARANG